MLQELISSSLSLTTDVFGNYVIQKLLEHGSVNQRAQLLSKVLISETPNFELKIFIYLYQVIVLSYLLSSFNIIINKVPFRFYLKLSH